MSGRKGRSRSRSPKRNRSPDTDRRRSPDRRSNGNSRDEKRPQKRDPSPKDEDSSYSLVPPSKRKESSKRDLSESPKRNKSPPQDRRRGRSPSSPRSARSSKPSSPSDFSRESERYGKPMKEESPKPKIEKEKPDFKPSGKLATVNKDGSGPALKWGEPPEARLPTKRWRLYVFKGDKPLDPYYVHRQSAYLFGRDRLVADIPVDHPSCSKQHAVLQYRMISKENEDGDTIKEVKPYIIDLGSTNGTFINSERIEDSRYYELRESDVIKFGLSTREFVLLHEESAE